MFDSSITLMVDSSVPLVHTQHSEALDDSWRVINPQRHYCENHAGSIFVLLESGTREASHQAVQQDVKFSTAFNTSALQLNGYPE